MGRSVCSSWCVARAARAWWQRFLPIACARSGATAGAGSTRTARRDAARGIPLRAEVRGIRLLSRAEAMSRPLVMGGAVRGPASLAVVDLSFGSSVAFAARLHMEQVSVVL